MDNSAHLDAVEARKKYIHAWNKLLLDIWHEKIYALKVIDTASLYRSLKVLKEEADESVTTVSLEQGFLEYGLWQEFGTGREVPIGNPGDIGRDKKRVRRPWFSPKYFYSSMRIRDFFIDSLAEEFIGITLQNLDSNYIRQHSAYYRAKGNVFP